MAKKAAVVIRGKLKNGPVPRGLGLEIFRFFFCKKVLFFDNPALKTPLRGAHFCALKMAYYERISNSAKQARIPRGIAKKRPLSPAKKRRRIKSGGIKTRRSLVLKIAKNGKI